MPITRLHELLILGISVILADAVSATISPGDFAQKIQRHVKDQGHDRQLQSVCLVVDIFSLEKEYQLDYGVPFSCSCQSEATSSNGVISCSSDAPYCCPDRTTGEIVECESASVSFIFAEALSAFFIPYGEQLEGTSCISYTAGPRSGSERCVTWEWWSCDNEESGDICSCDVVFDDTSCASCEPCGDTTEATKFDCTNVAAAEGLVSPDCSSLDLSGCMAQAEVNLPTEASTTEPQPTTGQDPPPQTMPSTAPPPPPQDTPSNVPTSSPTVGTNGEITSRASVVNAVVPAIAVAVLAVLCYVG